MVAHLLPRYRNRDLGWDKIYLQSSSMNHTRETELFGLFYGIWIPNRIEHQTIKEKYEEIADWLNLETRVSRTEGKQKIGKTNTWDSS